MPSQGLSSIRGASVSPAVALNRLHSKCSQIPVEFLVVEAKTQTQIVIKIFDDMLGTDHHVLRTPSDQPHV